jgi:hypothetical protein
MAFYGGRAGCGKSDVLIMGALQGIVHPWYRSLVMRRSYADLMRSGAVLDRMRTWFSQSPARWVGDE